MSKRQIEDNSQGGSDGRGGELKHMGRNLVGTRDSDRWEIGNKRYELIFST